MLIAFPYSSRQSGAGQGENSSDGDSSSTYGQIKTFESFFEGTNPVTVMKRMIFRMFTI